MKPRRTDASKPIYDVSKKNGESETLPVDENLALDGLRDGEILSEYMLWAGSKVICLPDGTMASFLATRRSFTLLTRCLTSTPIWLKTTRTISWWRKPIASLNYLLTSHVWRQNHKRVFASGSRFHPIMSPEKKADIVRIYLPPDANCLLSVADHCFKEPQLCKPLS